MKHIQLYYKTPCWLQIEFLSRNTYSFEVEAVGGETA